jgi:hypothetical protein
MSTDHGSCSRCDSLMIRDGDVMRHGPHQGCDAVAPIGNKVAAPEPVEVVSRDDIRDQAGVAEHPAVVRQMKAEAPTCPRCDGPMNVGVGQLSATSTAVKYWCYCGERTTGRRWYDVAFTALNPNLCPSCEQQPRTAPGQSCTSCKQPGGNTVAGNTNTERNTMTAPAQSGEVTGIPSAVHYMTQVAATHTQHGGNEQLITAAANMNIGDGDTALIQQAQEASRNAAELWTHAATTIDGHNAGVRQGYASAPDAADKHAQVTE